jgi:aryl-alcohol dehydrogenase-like predicted oxidoreductase
MEQRRFGDSDLVCSALGFGTWELCVTNYGVFDWGEVNRAVNLAIDRGVTLFDTAEVYGPFHSELLLARALGARRKDIVLVTKVGYNFTPDHRIGGRNSTYANVLSATDGCLQRLGTDYIDLLLIHWPDHDTPIPETMAALEKLKQDGKIRHYGVSNYNAPMMTIAEEHGHLTANQVGYNLFDRRMERKVLPFCQQRKIGYMAYGSLCYGLLSGAMSMATTFTDWDWRFGGKAFGLPMLQGDDRAQRLRVVQRLKKLAADHGKTVAQLAIAWVLGHPAVTVALVGILTPHMVEENTAALDWKLTAGDHAEIDRIFAEEGVTTYRDAPQAR